jgi:DNA-binding MarR family transcriptional regulator
MKDVDVELVSALRNVVTKLARGQRMQAMKVAGMPYSHSTLLSTLERVGKMTPTELASAEGVRKPVMTRSLAAVVQRGYVVREVDPRDGRQAVLELSETGRKALHIARKAINEWYMSLLENLDSVERLSLTEAIAAMSRLANELDSHTYDDPI